MLHKTLFALVIAAAVLTGCDNKPTQTAEPKPTGDAKSAAATPTDIPPDIFVTDAPTGARGVTDVKTDPNATGQVIVTGRIGGRPKSFVDGAAVFVLADPSLKDCIQRHGKEGCPMPWDYCCEPEENLKTGIATVRIVDADGKPYPFSAEGQHGLAHLVDITVIGEIQPRQDTNVLVIDAQKIHINKEQTHTDLAQAG